MRIAKLVFTHVLLNKNPVYKKSQDIKHQRGSVFIVPDKSKRFYFLSLLFFRHFFTRRQRTVIKRNKRIDESSIGINPRPLSGQIYATASTFPHENGDTDCNEILRLQSFR